MFSAHADSFNENSQKVFASYCIQFQIKQVLRKTKNIK